jgi:hypothetical protein
MLEEDGRLAARKGGPPRWVNGKGLNGTMPPGIIPGRRVVVVLVYGILESVRVIEVELFLHYG